MCPKTFSILGIMSWDNPLARRHTGRIPETRTAPSRLRATRPPRRPTCWGAYVRGCYEGWESWLKSTGTGTYAAGDLWGCIGARYHGVWHDSAERIHGRLTPRARGHGAEILAGIGRR
jgi:hypothetical protein